MNGVKAVEGKAIGEETKSRKDRQEERIHFLTQSV